MRKPKEWELWTSLAFLPFLLWGMALLTGYRPQECEEAGKSCQTLQEPVSLLLYPFFWVANWIDGHDKIVVGLSGIAVAAFTFTLWRSTRALWKAGDAQGVTSQQIADATTKAANAAELHAKATTRALDELERPWLYLDTIGIKRRELPNDSIVPNFWFADLHFRNVGRAPAIVTACTFKFGDKDGLPDNPDYTGFEMLSTEIIVGPRELVNTNPVGPGDKRAEQLVMYGFIAYESMRGAKYITGYAIEVSKELPVSGSYRNKNYTYYK